jgi:tetratricopeptide (TPR) repeat protein
VSSSVPDRVVARYLQQTRLLRGSAEPNATLAGIYHRNFDDILQRLGIENAIERPNLDVTYSPDALVETLSIGGRRTIVYDQYLGQVFNRLTDFAICEWPANFVMEWGFKQLAIELAGLGRFAEASIAMMLWQKWPEAVRPSERSAEMRDARGLLVGIQEYFVMAHECAHAALALGQGTLGVDVDEFYAVVDKIIDDDQEQARNADPEALAVLNRRILDDNVRAIYAGSPVDVEESEPPSLASLDVPSEWTERDPEQLANWITERGHLREEILCDVIATRLTMARYADYRMGPSVVIPNLLHALHNLTSIEVIRGAAREVANAPHASQVTETLARKRVWRAHVELEYAGQVNPSGWLHGALVQVTDLHARTVGDLLLFSLMVEFDRAFKAVVKDLPDNAELRDGVLEALPRLGTGATAAEIPLPEKTDREERDGLASLSSEPNIIDDPEGLCRRADEEGDARGAYDLGLLLRENDDVMGAEAAFGRAAERGYLQAFAELGALLEARGDINGAEAALRHADAAGEVRATHGLGLLLLNKGDMDGAEDAFRRADERGDAVAACNLGLVLDRGRGMLDEAEKAFKRAVERGYLPALTPLGNLLGQRGDLDGAERAWRRADMHGDADAAAIVALLLESRGDIAGAEAARRRASERGFRLPPGADDRASS